MSTAIIIFIVFTIFNLLILFVNISVQRSIFLEIGRFRKFLVGFSSHFCEEKSDTSSVQS